MGQASSLPLARRAKCVLRDFGLRPNGRQDACPTKAHLFMPATAPPSPTEPLVDLPEVDLRHLGRMTDDTGLFQHALYATPDCSHGYCIDDNARGLIAGLLYARLFGHDDNTVPLHRYLGFVAYALNPDTGTFRNFMGYDRRWLEDEGSHDSQGRNVWALGLTVRLGPTQALRSLARELYERAVEGLALQDHLRSFAFALQGMDAFLQAVPDHGQTLEARVKYAELLYQKLQERRGDDWPWWEDLVTYDNAKLPHALLLAGPALYRDDMTAAGLETLRWLLDVQTTGGDGGRCHLSIIGNDGWLPRGGERAPFDQQPLEAYALVDACLCAARVDTEHRERWEGDARMCLDWFRGRNDLSAPLADPATGGCRDGLQPSRTNQNQGAESTLAYLLAVLLMHGYARERGG